MTEQRTLLTLLPVRLDTDRPRTPVVGQLQMQIVFLRMWTPNYLHLKISDMDIIIYKVLGLFLI